MNKSMFASYFLFFKNLKLSLKKKKRKKKHNIAQIVEVGAKIYFIGT